MPDLLQQGVALHRAGKLAEAEAIYRKVLSSGENADAMHLLGVVALQMGQHSKALDLIARAILLSPKSADFHTDFGLALAGTGRHDEALGAYRKSIAIRPDRADPYSLRGNSLLASGLLNEAIAEYRKALDANPAFTDALDNLGRALILAEKTDEAIEVNRKAVAARPNDPKAHNMLGLALSYRPEYEQAIGEFQKALALATPSADVYGNMGNAMMDCGRTGEAMAAFDRARVIQSNNSVNAANRLLCMHYIPDSSPEKIFREHAAWGAQISAAFGRGTPEHKNKRDPDRVLRVGYVSADFRAHSVGFFLENFLAHHDRDAVNLFAYADLHDPDDVSARLKSSIPNWRRISGMTVAQIAALIARDEIDILVDLAGHTSGNRLPVFAGKPAPIQITYLGYPDTTGLTEMDYRLTDDCADPVGTTEQFHTEKLLRLEDCFLCFTPPTDAPPPGALPATERGYVTFGCFNTQAKINARLIDWWTKILRAVPDSRFILKNRALTDPAVAVRLRNAFGSAGIDPSRIDTRGWESSRQGHLAIYQSIDIALDTFPYHGTATTCEALWMGVPVLTLAGETHAQRVGVSLLSNLAMKKWIAKDPENYIRLATKYAGDLPALAKVRKGLRKKMVAITDGKAFAKNLENAYRQVWRKWCDPNGAAQRAETIGTRIGER